MNLPSNQAAIMDDLLPIDDRDEERGSLQGAPANAMCRLCAGKVSQKFCLQVLGQYKVGYLECERCRSLQTVAPYWLSETYSGDLPNLDVGAARRPLRTCALVLLASRILRLRPDSRILDFGGGDGLTCRLLRDAGFDAYVFDKYAVNNYAAGYSAEPSDEYDIICAIEVLEHLPEPNAELSLMFSRRPRLVIVATDCYSGQNTSWPYLGPEQGGHVFFYSREAMAWIAKQYGYDLVSHGSTTVFARERLSPVQRTILQCALRPEGLLLGRVWLQLMRPRRGPSALQQEG